MMDEIRELQVELKEKLERVIDILVALSNLGVFYVERDEIFDTGADLLDDVEKDLNGETKS